MAPADKKASAAGGQERRRLGAVLFGLLEHPVTLITLAVLAAGVWIVPPYLNTVRRQIIQGDLWLSICGGLTPRKRGIEQPRRPLM